MAKKTVYDIWLSNGLSDFSVSVSEAMKQLSQMERDAILNDMSRDERKIFWYLRDILKVKFEMWMSMLGKTSEDSIPDEVMHHHMVVNDLTIAMAKLLVSFQQKAAAE